MAQAVRRLWMLSEQFSQRDDPRAACHCLLTALALVNAPSIECQLRIRLAQLLLANRLESAALPHLHKALALSARWQAEPALVWLIKILLIRAGQVELIGETVAGMRERQAWPWLLHLAWMLLQRGIQLTMFSMSELLAHGGVLLVAVDALLPRHRSSFAISLNHASFDESDSPQAHLNHGGAVLDSILSNNHPFAMDPSVAWLLAVASAYAKLDHGQVKQLLEQAPQSSSLAACVVFLGRLRTISPLGPVPDCNSPTVRSLLQAQLSQVLDSQANPEALSPVLEQPHQADSIPHDNPYAECMRALGAALEAQRQGQAVHQVKGNLLAALKILNGGVYVNNLAKACVLLMLGQLYAETDFGLARSMLEGTLKYAQALGQARLSQAARSLLARIPVPRG